MYGWTDGLTDKHMFIKREREREKREKEGLMPLKLSRMNHGSKDKRERKIDRQTDR